MEVKKSVEKQAMILQVIHNEINNIYVIFEIKYISVALQTSW